MKQSFVHFLLLWLLSTSVEAQSFEVVNNDTINRIDTAGLKQGKWKYWDNNLSLALTCYYKDNQPVGKQTYYQKNHPLLELEPHKTKKEITWKYYGSGKAVTGKLRQGKRKFEFVNVKGKKLKKAEIQILTEILEQDASFVGGYYELFRYFKDNIHYPKSSQQAGKEGIVEVTFLVKESGEIDEVRLVSGFDVDCNEAALTCVRTMPRWRPATKMGYTFESKVKVPVQFKL